MAEIKIEKKKSVWLLVLLIFGVTAVLLYLLSLNDGSQKMEKIPETTDLLSVHENLATVIAFVVFVESDSNKMTFDHAYTNEALLKLVEATNAIADEVGYDIKADIDQVKEYAEIITVEPYETTHANNIRKAADILTNILQNIQQAKYPGLSNEVVQLRNASSLINPDVLTLNQKNAVKSFFSSAADLLKKMN